MLKTAVIGKTINGATQVTRVMAISGDKIILVDATTGQAPKKVSTKIVDKDLHIFAEGATEPSVIVSDYVLYDQTVQISGLGSSGEYVNYGLTATNTMELGAVSAMPATASTPFMSSSAWWGVGILAIAGGAAAAGGGGGGSSSGSNTISPTPIASTTHTATLVDSIVSGVTYTTTSGLGGVTGSDGVAGSFNYKAGDIVTFKVGNATIGTFNTVNINTTDNILTIQEIVGVARTNTTDAKVINIAQFLQSLDSIGTVADGITIDSAKAALITTAIDIQAVASDTIDTTLTAAIKEAMGSSATLVSAVDATLHLNSISTDATSPTATITLSDTVLNSGETAIVTIKFSEPGVNFNNSDVSVANGILSTLSTTDNITWTATLTPTASFVAATNAISIANTYTDAAGNAGTSAISGNYTIDTKITPPAPVTVAITDDEPATTANIAGGEIVYTFTFSEAVHGFSSNGITVTNGTAGVFKQLSSSVYTLSVVPNVINSGEVVVNVKAGSATNSIGTANEAAYTSYQAVDMVAPTVTSIVLTDTTPTSPLSNGALSYGETENVTVTFSEAVANFDNTSVSLAGAQGTLGKFTSSDNIHWTGIFTPTANTGDSSNIIQVLNTYTDAAGNVGTLKDSDNFVIDTVASPIQITSGALTNDTTPTVTGTAQDGATITAVIAGVSHTATATGGVWSITPTVALLEGANSVSVTSTIGGITSSQVIQSLVVDTTAPTATITMEDTALKAGETSLVTIKFSEAVQNLTLSDFTAQNGTLTTLTTADNKTWTALFTPNANVEDTTNTISLAATYNDVAGNSATVTVASANYAIDTLAPSAPTFALTTDNGLSGTDGITDTNGITVTLVTGITNWEYSLNSGTSWTTGAIPTVATPVAPAIVGITSSTFNLVANTSYAAGQIEVRQTDTNGNVSTVATNTQTMLFDTTLPVVTITNDQVGTANIGGGEIVYTFTFNEPVSGFAKTNITIKDAGGADISATAAGTFIQVSDTVYTLSVTPLAGDTGNMTVNVAASMATDIAGNNNTASLISYQPVDMLAPNVIASGIAFTNASGTAITSVGYGETANVTVTFSEKVQDPNTHISVAGAQGALGTLTTSDGGTTWKGVFTPTASISDATNVIQVTNGYTDLAGNAGSSFTSSNLAIDTRPGALAAPTIALGTDDGIAGDGITHTNGITVSGITATNWEYSLNGGTTWTAGVAPIAPATTSTFTLTANTSYASGQIEVRQYSDAANKGTIATNTQTLLVDTAAPTVTITNDQVGTANIGGGEIVYTFTFSEAVNGFSTADIVIKDSAGVVITPTTSVIQVSPTVYTLVVTPKTGDTGSMTVDIAAGTATTGVTDTAGNYNVASFQSIQAVDMFAPTVKQIDFLDSAGNVISSTDATVDLTGTHAALAENKTGTVSITFTEAVTNFDNTDVSLAGAKGTLGTLTSADNIHWTGIFTPSATTSDASNIIQVLNTYTDVAGNAGTAKDSSNFTIDTRPTPVAAPTLVLTTDTAGTDINLDSSITIADLNTDGITKVNGVTVTLATGITNWEYSLNGGTSWTTGAIPTVAGGITSSTFNLVANTSYAAGQIEVRQTDSNGNISTIATNTQTTIVDTIAAIPIITAVVTTIPNVVDASNNANLVISGTGEAGAIVTLAVAAQTAIIDASGAWNIVVLDPATSFGQGSETLSVTQTDVAGNVSLSATRNIFIDTVKPTLDSLIPVKANIGSDSIALTFSENLTPVYFAGAGDFNVEINGVLYTPSSGLISAISVTGKTVTMIFDTNVHNINFGDTIRIVYLDTAGDAGTAIQDLIGNDAPSFGYVTATVENTDTPPVLINMTADYASDTVVLTFNELLNSGVANLPPVSDFAVKINGIPGSVSTVAILDASVTLVFTTPINNGDLVEVVYTDNTSLTNAIQDLIGNDALSFTYVSTAVDLTSPTATITMADVALKIGDTSVVTIVFSEVVLGFNNGDVTALNGTLTAFATVDNTTWTATFTPTSNIEDTSNAITLATTYTDLAGNIGKVANSTNYTIDTLAPTATITMADTALKIGDTSVVTIVFSEVVLAFSNADVTAPNGTLTAFITADNITWTATFTPTNNIEDPSNVIALATTYTDLAGNVGTASNSANYTVDTLAPTAIITMADTALKIGDTSLVTIAFSEAVANFANADITAPNGTLDAFTTVDNITWTATFTPTSTIEDASNVIALATTYTDLAGNVGTASNSANYTVDTLAPTAIITMADTALKIWDTSLVTIAFSEAVTNFSNADVTAPNGGLSAFGSVDGGVTWTATFTPTNNIEDITNAITLATTYSDLSGNVGTVATSLNYTVDTLAPTFVSMIADESLDTIVMTFSEALDFTNIPTDGQFAISLNSGADLLATQYSVAVSGSTLTLTLDDLLIVNTQTAKVTYTDSTAGNDVLAIQDLVGNDILNFNNTVNAVL